MTGNKLLDALPPDLREAIAADLDLTFMPRSLTIVQEGGIMEFIYFPTTCLLSTVVTVQAGNTVEACTIGQDGFLGIPALLGSPMATNTTMVQVEGEALRLSMTDFLRHLQDERLRGPLGAYANSAFGVIAQSTACLAFHPVQERLARWLLMVRDGVGRPEFKLTQEFMAVMLGVQRPTVTITVRSLVVAGLIEHRRASIRIIDEAGLEEAACECYQLARSRLLVQ